MTLWLGHTTHKIVSEMTCNVSSGTLNPTILYYSVLHEILHQRFYSTVQQSDICCFGAMIILPLQ